MNNTQNIFLDNWIIENLFMDIYKNKINVYIDSKKHPLYLNLTIKKHYGLNKINNIYYLQLFDNKKKIKNNSTFIKKHNKFYYIIYTHIYNIEPSYNNNIELYVDDKTNLLTILINQFMM